MYKRIPAHGPFDELRDGMTDAILALSLGDDERTAPGRPGRRAKPPVGFSPDAAGYANPLDAFLAGVEFRAFKIAQYALRDEQTALDVVQDAMLKLAEKYGHKPPSEWPALFFTILNNRVTDVRRWRRLREIGGRSVSLFRKHEDGEEDLLESGLGAENNPPQQQPETAVFAKQLRKRIDSALQYLSERQRQVFILREWQGLSVRDTATILGCSEGSVKQHHFRAMRSLRENLAEVWDHD